MWKKSNKKTRKKYGRRKEVESYGLIVLIPIPATLEVGYRYLLTALSLSWIIWLPLHLIPEAVKKKRCLSTSLPRTLAIRTWTHTWVFVNSRSDDCTWLGGTARTSWIHQVESWWSCDAEFDKRWKSGELPGKGKVQQRSICWQFVN